MNAVMKMYQEVLSQVKVEGEDSREFAVKVGIYQGSILSPLIFAVVMDMVTEEVVKEECAVMYADDLVLISETKEEARQRFVAWRNVLESKGLKVNISKTKVMRCAWDGALKEAAVDPCSVRKRVGVNSIHCTTCGYTGNVQEREEVWQEWHRALCAKCVELEEEKQLMSFASKMSS